MAIRLSESEGGAAADPYGLSEGFEAAMKIAEGAERTERDAALSVAWRDPAAAALQAFAKFSRCVRAVRDNYGAVVGYVILPDQFMVEAPDVLAYVSRAYALGGGTRAPRGSWPSAKTEGGAE